MGKIIRRNSKVSWRLENEKIHQIEATKDEDMLSDLDRYAVFISYRNDLFELNLVGAKIWLLCDGKRTKKDIIERLLKQYKTSKEELNKDVEQFLFELASHKLIICE